MFACNRRYGSGGLGKSAILVRSSGGIENGFIVIVCRACKDPPCFKACPVGALSLREGGGVILDTRKCIGCGRCKEACAIGAIQWDGENNKPDICVHCGYCVQYCPHEVLRLSEVEA
jgi:Fe-S-cluster-containing dehydrogenase component